jgi:hypothetical protein
MNATSRTGRGLCRIMADQAVIGSLGHSTACDCDTIEPYHSCGSHRVPFYTLFWDFQLGTMVRLVLERGRSGEVVHMLGEVWNALPHCLGVGVLAGCLA